MATKMELSQGTKKLLEQYQIWYQGLQPKEQQASITVDEVAARVASFYEKIRGVVDWREEHLLKKTAIERILKRRFLLNGKGPEMAEPLLQELVRGGHFPNARIPVQKIEEVQRAINKYMALVDRTKEVDWMLTLAACEIEEILAPRIRERALIDYMSSVMEQQIKIRERDSFRITLQERTVEIFVGVERALFKLDDTTIALHVLERFYPNWETGDLNELKKTIDSILRHKLAERFYRLVERHDTPYLLLGDIISKDPLKFEELAQNSPSFETAVRQAYSIRLTKLKSRIGRAAFFSTLSVFLSKVLVALAVEYPIDAKITHQFNYVALIASIAIPPLFLFFFIRMARSSSEENIQRTLLEVGKITYATDRKETYEIGFPRKRNSVMNFFLYIIYFSMFVLSFGVFAFVLEKYHFSTLSMAVFLLFFSLVAFIGTRLRERAKELIVGEQKEGFLYGLFDFFGLPFVQVGKWLSGQIAKYNVLILLLNVLIEAPFQVFIEFLEQLRTFWKEKKEEIH